VSKHQNFDTLNITEPDPILLGVVFGYASTKEHR
jgi:hypothetical protein